MRQKKESVENLCGYFMGLKEKFDEATRRNDVRAIVLTGKVSMD